MAKKSKKNGKRNKKGGGGMSPWEAVGAAALSTLGNALGQLVADGAEGVFARRDAGGRGGGSANGSASHSAPSQRDVVDEILQRLQRDDGATVADLVCGCAIGLTSTIEAVRGLRELRLVDVANDGRISLTDSGRQTAAALFGDEALAHREEEESEDTAEAMPE